MEFGLEQTEIEHWELARRGTVFGKRIDERMHSIMVCAGPAMCFAVE